MKGDHVLYESRSEEWYTPQYVFDELNREFNFDVDVCATHDNAKCPKFYTKETNGLAQQWEGTCWMNPPYGKAIGDWMKKAYESSLTGVTVVCLVFMRSDTRWFHDYAMRAEEIRLIKGRLAFGGAKNSAPCPSCVVIFRPGGQDGYPKLSVQEFSRGQGTI